MLYITSDGQLGKYLKARAEKNKIPYMLLSRPDFDLENQDSLLSFFNGKRGGVVVNTAACTNVDLIEKDADEASRANIVNSKAVGELAGLCKQHDMRFIHISTDFVFNGVIGAPYTEDDMPDPINKYGASKLSGEVECVLENADSMILRTSWLFSGSQNSFVGKVLKWAYNNRSLNMVSDQFGNPVYAGDLADLIIYLSSLKNWYTHHNVYHAVNPHPTSRFYFATAILEEAIKIGFRNKFGEITTINPVLHSDFQSDVPRPLDTRLSCHRLKEIYGVEMRDWAECLPDVVSAAVRGFSPTS